MSGASARGHATLDDWIKHDSLPFSLDSAQTVSAVIDSVVTSLGRQVDLLGFGEALHGSEEIMVLRNRFFQRLVEAHGYRAIALETSFARAHLVNEYVAGRGPSSYEGVRDAGFGEGFGGLEANRDLVQWMRTYNADASHKMKLRFYGLDIPTGKMGIASPNQVLQFALDYLAVIDSASAQEHRERVDAFLAQAPDWENPAAWADPTKSAGRSPAAASLRIETEDLIIELRTRRPELVARSDRDRYLEALHSARVARELLNFHAALGRKSGEPPAGPRGVRDALMAANLRYMVERERGRGKVFAFAHNAHLQRGQAVWPCCGQKYLGTDVFTWWPAGSQLNETLGSRYAVIGTAVGVSDENGIGEPEAGALEARLFTVADPALFVATHRGHGLPAAEIAALPTRSGSENNMTYTALVPQSFTDFDWIAFFKASTYNRGGPPLTQWSDAGDTRDWGNDGGESVGAPA